MANFVISFPKCGRTWLRIALGKSLALEHEWERQEILSPTSCPNYPVFSHSMDTTGCPSIAGIEPWSVLPKQLDSFVDSNVLLLVRNPLDVMVSYFCHRSHRCADDGFAGDISEFIRTEHYGMDKLLFFLNLWNEHSKSLKGFRVVRYEDMHTDLLPILQDVFEFFDLGGIPESVIEQAVEFSSFKNMKKQQDSGYWNNRRFSTGHHPDSAKVRRGVVNGYDKYLSEDDISYAKSRMDIMGCPFYRVDEV